MFRIQNNVPGVYVDQSRDFQLFCRLYDCLQDGVKYDINTITNILDALKISDSALELLCSRVGFFPRIRLDTNVLKYIVAAFPYLIKNKGNIEGIKGAVNAVLKAENDPKAIEEIIVTISNIDYSIKIFTANDIYNKVALREVFRYIIPFGYTYTLYTYGSIVPLEQSLVPESGVTNLKVLSTRIGAAVSVKSVEEDGNIDATELAKKISGYNTGFVVGYNDLLRDNNGNIITTTLEDFPAKEMGESVTTSGYKENV